MESFPNPIMIDGCGVRLATYQQGEGTPIVLVHGWPEIAYSWKNQIGPLGAAGYRAIALDLRGFGRSDAPSDKSLYSIRHITNDLVALLDRCKIDKAIFCGHDWGGAIVWPMAQLHPDRVAGVIGVCTPHRAPPPVPPLSIVEKRFGPKHYFIEFQKPDVAEALFASDVERFFRLMFRRPASAGAVARLGPKLFDLVGRFRDGPPPDPHSFILSAEDLAIYVNAYAHSGFHGGINLYRNIDVNYAIMKEVNPTIRASALMISAADDIFLPPAGVEGMEAIVPNLEKKLIANCGHWVMWERPNELNALMLDWLARHNY